MNKSLVFVTAAALGATSAWAKMPPKQFLTQLLPQMADSQYSSTQRLGEDGQILSWYRLDAAVSGATPQDMARDFLDRNARNLGLSALSQLQHFHTRSGPAGHNVHFQQFLGTVPVYASRYIVHINPQGRVTQFSRSHVAPAALSSSTPTLNALQATQLAGEALGLIEPKGEPQVELVAYPQATASILAWQVRLPASAPAGDWEVLLNASDGAVLAMWDRAAYEGPTGVAFDPDPLSSSQTAYGQPIVDNDDADYPEIAAEVKLKELGDLRQERGLYWVSSPWAELVDSEAPNNGLFAQASPDFIFNREELGFEASNVFWHIQHSMQYINEVLGIALMPYQYEGGVRFDPHGVDGDDNSHYSPSSGEVAFGEGCVDDSEDADVIWHELGHGIHDWVTAGGLSNYIDGLSEGFGDYWAQSYSRSLGQWQFDSAEYQWVFNWDGHNECWGGRVTNYDLPWPVGISPFPAIHTGGQIWSTALMKIFDRIGREKTDVAVLEGLAMTNTISSQNDAANAVYQAAEDMAYDSSELAVMFSEFSAAGYLIGVSLPLILEPGDNEPADQDADANSQSRSADNDSGGAGLWWLMLLPLALRRRK